MASKELHTTVIKDIFWYDKDGFEADIIFTINGIELTAFCHPCSSSIGDKVESQLSLLLEDIPNDSFWQGNVFQERSILQDGRDSTRYYCNGQIVSIDPVTVDVGNLLIEYGDITNDQQVIGCYVYFVISRLDANVVHTNSVL